MNQVLEVGRRARRQTRRTELRRRGRPVRRVAPRVRASGRLRDAWPSADLQRPAPEVGPRLWGARTPGAVVAGRARLPLAQRTPRSTPLPPVVSPARPAGRDAVGTAVVETAPVPDTAPVPVTTPVPATAPVAETTAVPATAPVSRGRRRSWVLAGVAAVLVVVGGSAAVVAVTVAGDGPGSATTTAAAARPELVAWLRADLAGPATVAAVDPALRRGLTEAGVPVVTVFTAADLDTGAFLVAAATGDDPTAPVAVGDDRALVPVARFGDDASAVVVAQLVAGTPATVVGDRDTERDTARAATAGLLVNAAVTVSPAARPSLQAGRLDLRAAAFVALLANQVPVTVTAIRTDAAEQAAGVADRRVVVTVADTAALRAAVAGTRDPYAPIVTTADTADLPTGSALLTWPLLADPTTVVS